MNTSASVEPLRTGTLLLLMAAVFTVSLGYGIVLPLLPFFLERVLAGSARFPIAWHTGMLSGIYMFALFVFAPLWGSISDHIGRRVVILLGLGGYGLALVLFGLSEELWLGYLSRILAGAFASAVLPVTLAYVADMSSPERRARCFAWMSAASLLGFLAGPGLGGWLSGADISLVPYVDGGMHTLPFFAAAAIGFAVWAGCYFRLPEAAPGKVDHGSPRAKNSGAMTSPLALTLLAMFGLGSFEVGITLQGQQILGLTPSRIGILFMECSLVMVVAQIVVFSPLARSFGNFPIVTAAFLGMAAGLGGLATTRDFGVLLFWVGLVSASAGVLLPLLTYRVSLDAGMAQGAALGRQAAAASLGQAAGSAAAGLLFGLMPESPFWITAGMLLIGVAAGKNTNRGISRRQHTL